MNIVRKENSSKNFISKVTDEPKKGAKQPSSEPEKAQSSSETQKTETQTPTKANETGGSAFDETKNNEVKSDLKNKNTIDGIEKLLEDKDVAQAFGLEEETSKDAEYAENFEMTDTKDFFNALQVDSVDEFKDLVEDLDLNVNIDYERLSKGNYEKSELDEISQAVSIALENSDTENLEDSLKLNDVGVYQYLSDKYNLGIDFNSQNPTENLTGDELKLFAQAYITDIQSKHLNATNESMNSYFNSLGAIDNAYDFVKDKLDFGITRDDVAEYSEKEQEKNDFLASIVQNGGEISLSDENTKQKLNDIISYNAKNMELDEMIDYSTKYLGVKKEDIDEFKKNHKELFNEFGGKLVDDNGNIVSDEEIKKAFIKDLAKFDNQDSLSFEKAYEILNGVDYNEELITNIIDSQEVYSSMVKEEQNAVAFEQILTNASPVDALDYFNILAEKANDGTTGEELFNKYYADLFAKYPEKLSSEGLLGVKCLGISVKDGYLWQEVSYPEGTDMDLMQSSDFLYKETDENGNDRYYKVVNLNNEREVLSNLSGEIQSYTMNFFGSKWEDPTYSNNPLEFFYRANDSILNDDLHLKNIKQKFDNEYGEGAYDAVLEKYPKMYEEAFGKSPLAKKLASYKEDMDTYERDISIAACAGCLVAACCGVSVPMSVGVLSTFSDNLMRGVNIDTSNLSEREKHALRKQLLAETMIEGSIFTIGTAANSAIQDINLDFILDYRSAIGASSEYAIESGSDTVDIIRTAIV